MIIITKNVEVDYKQLKELRKAINDDHLLLSNLLLEKRVCNKIFVVAIYEYNNNGFLW